ncbi:MAG TPA: hypothetical protein VKB47_10530 [Terracidiphilus sp.]|nr:hypothetical protein [Terracidiphilus sp.]
MASLNRPIFLAQVLSCWNWKCALLSATARSTIYLVAMTRTHHADGRAIVLVEMAYVTLTAGIYAALQQRALGLRSRLLGNLIVVFGVPGLAQALDWTTHRLSGAAAPQRATLAVCIFAALSALFHLHVMRNGVFLTGHGRSLADDFRRVPRLVAGFVARPFTLLATSISRTARALESDAAL